MKFINILAFPGNNCEKETARTIREAGFKSNILRWNSPAQEILQSDGLVIPGGFSFEDRGRSGRIAASNSVLKLVWKMAEEGKPILGICNGAQILVESGLVPGYSKDFPQMALSRNRRDRKFPVDKGGQEDFEIHTETGFYHDFVHLTPGGRKCAWTNFEGAIRMPIANAEGRFLATEEVYASLQKNKQEALFYSNKNEEVIEEFPINPNGTLNNLAAVCNIQGNVMAMMPHPERMSEGGGIKIFQSLHKFFEKKTDDLKSPSNKGGLDSFSLSENLYQAVPIEFSSRKQYDIEIFVELKITDTTEKTLEMTLQRVLENPNIKLQRKEFWGIETNDNPLDIAQKLIDSEEFFNENKELAIFKISHLNKEGVGDFGYYKTQNGKLEKIEAPKDKFLKTILATEKDDILGDKKKESLKKHMGIDLDIHSGVLWSFSEEISDEEIAKTMLFGNPINWELQKS